jgi:hypothetical protein
MCTLSFSVCYIGHTNIQAVAEILNTTYEGVSKSFRTGRLERELKTIQLFATRCSCYHYFVSQYSEFCRHNPLCCFSTSVYCCC